MKEERTIKVFSLLTKGDKILILALIGLTFSIFFLQMTSQTHSGQRRVFIEVDKRVVQRFMLREKAVPQEISISLPEGEARLEMKGGRVRMLAMKREICPKGICSQMGWIGRPGQMIICMPNKLVVGIEASKGEGVEAAIDAVTR
ncbi:MAG: NusG domain II-containing protein [Thermodesulfobacteriota bacterium]